MKTKPPNKTALTPEEKLMACVAVLIYGIDQHVVAALQQINIGRVNEAVMDGRRTFGFPMKTKESDEEDPI